MQNANPTPAPPAQTKKYKKKPVVVEAVQYTTYGKLVPGMCNSISCFSSGNSEPHVHTIHDNQIVLLAIGDYVIPEPDGEHFYPCKPDIFEATYEPVSTTPEDVSTKPENVDTSAERVDKTAKCIHVSSPEELPGVVAAKINDARRHRDGDDPELHYTTQDQTIVYLADENAKLRAKVSDLELLRQADHDFMRDNRRQIRGLQAQLSAAQEQIAQLTTDKERLEQALKDVCDPLGYLRREAEAQGRVLNGFAYTVASDIGTLKKIAKDALHSSAEGQHGN